MLLKIYNIAHTTFRCSSNNLKVNLAGLYNFQAFMTAYSFLFCLSPLFFWKTSLSFVLIMSDATLLSMEFFRQLEWKEKW